MMLKYFLDFLLNEFFIYNFRIFRMLGDYFFEKSFLSTSTPTAPVEMGFPIDLMKPMDVAKMSS